MSTKIEKFGIQKLIEKYPTQESCIKELEKRFWNDKPFCPHCQSTKFYRIKNKKYPYRCANKECRKNFNVLVGSIFEGSKIPLQKWFIAIYLVTAHKKGISSLQLARDIAVTQKTAWFMAHRIREAFAEKMSKQMSGTIEADETYIGGKERFKHKNKKSYNVRGRNTDNKNAVFGLLERDGEVRIQPVNDVSKNTLHSIINEAVRKNSRLITDEFRSYKGLKKNYKHKTVNHGEGKYVGAKNIHTNSIEGVWSILKKGLVGIYHSFSKKHLHRYCNEFAFRYNTRKITEFERIILSFVKTSKKRLSWNMLVK